MLWGRNDQSVTANSTTTKESSNGAPIGTYALVKGSGQGPNAIPMDANAHFGNTSPGSRASVDVAMFGNTTIGAFIPGMAIGVFAVNTTSMNINGGGLAGQQGGAAVGVVTYSGTGYLANTANFIPTPTNGGTGGIVNAVSNSVGKIVSFNLANTGSGYNTNPTLTIPAPALIQVGANATYINATANVIMTSSAQYFQVNDHITYVVSTGNTAIVGLTGNTSYYISFANSSALALTNTTGGANLQLTVNATSTETGHNLKGDTATGYVDINAVYPQVAHAGWVVRREGTGGRAGRVHFETLVAAKTIGLSGTTATGSVGAASPASNTVDTNI